MQASKAARIPKKLESRAISDCVVIESSTFSSKLATLLTRMPELISVMAWRVRDTISCRFAPGVWRMAKFP
jgi:hypothetical protein